MCCVLCLPTDFHDQEMNTEELTRSFIVSDNAVQPSFVHVNIGSSAYESDLYRKIRVEEDAWLAKNLKNARAFVSRKKEKWTLRDKCEAMRIQQQFAEYITLYYERIDDDLLQELAKILDFVHFEKWMTE
jgi:hypothetical protein